MQFTGNETQIDNVLQPLSLLRISEIAFMKTAIRSNLNNLLTETRVYAVDSFNYEFDSNPKDWEESKFISEAEIQGNVFSLAEFQNQVNSGDFNIENSQIRFITVKL